MKPSSIITMVCATLVAIGTAGWLAAEEPPRIPYPKATPPPPPSPVYTPSKESAPTLEEIEKAAREHNGMLAMVIERALAAGDAQQRETAFTFLLPELLQIDPQRVVGMFARQQRGEARDVLRSEMARQWVAQDRDAAVDWMKSLENRAERRDAAQAAVTSLAAVDPAQAIHVADQFGIGRDDGSLEHLVQMWAEENPEAAKSWIATRPDGPRTEQLRARIDQVLSSKTEREATN